MPFCPNINWLQLQIIHFLFSNVYQYLRIHGISKYHAIDKFKYLLLCETKKAQTKSHFQSEITCRRWTCTPSLSQHRKSTWKWNVRERFTAKSTKEPSCKENRRTTTANNWELCKQVCTERKVYIYIILENVLCMAFLSSLFFFRFPTQILRTVHVTWG